MRRRSSLAAVAAILAGTLAAGCDTLKSLGLVETDVAAERAERLRIPPDLSAEGINDRMALPGGGSYSQLKSGGDRLANAGEDLKVHKAGGQRWLTVEAAPEQVWKWLHGFLEQHGIKIAREAPRLGVVQTDWILRPIAIPRGVFSPMVKDVKDAQVADHYLLRVEQGVKPGTSEVYVAHRRIAAEQPGPEADWSLRPSDSFLEAEMLRGFMLYLGQQTLDSIQQIAATEAGKAQAQLDRTEQGLVQLELSDDFADAWRRVGLAIDRLGFTLEDRNRSEGQYFIRYDPDAETGPREKGFFESLAFWRDDAPENVPLYVIKLGAAAGGTDIHVTDEAGEPAPAEVSERILALLHEQLR